MASNRALRTQPRTADLMHELTDQSAGGMNGLVRLLDWVGEEDRRTYVKTIPSRSADMDWNVRHRRVGSVATFTSWNFPA